MLPRNAEEIYAICRNLQGFMIACLSYSVVLMLSGDAHEGAPQPSGTPSWRLAVCLLLVCTFLSDSVVRELLVQAIHTHP